MKLFDFSESKSSILFKVEGLCVYGRNYICFGRYSYSSYCILGETLCN